MYEIKVFKYDDNNIFGNVAQCYANIKRLLKVSSHADFSMNELTRPGPTFSQKTKLIGQH